MLPTNGTAVFPILSTNRTGPLASAERLATSVLRSEADRLVQRTMFESNVKDSFKRHQEIKDLIRDASNSHRFPNQTHQTSKRSFRLENDPAVEVIIQYSDLIDGLLDQVSTVEDKIGHGIRARLMNARIESHKRETRLLSKSYGIIRLKETLQSRVWSLADMEKEPQRECRYRGGVKRRSRQTF